MMDTIDLGEDPSLVESAKKLEESQNPTRKANGFTYKVKGQDGKDHHLHFSGSSDENSFDNEAVGVHLDCGGALKRSAGHTSFDALRCSICSLLDPVFFPQYITTHEQLRRYFTRLQSAVPIR